MNCKSVQEWLPLYVGHDLEENRNRVINAHLKSCTTCAGLATEYHETCQLLGDFTPPAFGEDVYSSIRQNVLREAPHASPGPLAQLFLNIFRPQVAWAVASVLLFAVCLFAFYFIANRRSINQPVAVLKPEAPPHSPTGGPSNSPPEKAIKPHRIVTRKRFGLADRGATTAVNRRGQPSIRSEAALESNNLAGPTAVQSSGKFIRLEMQTKDPNIRIIWLTPQRTKHETPLKVSRGV
jgi:Putative zinc-finger